jgi:hypothetical protein
MVERVESDNYSEDFKIKPFLSIPIRMKAEIVSAFISEGAKMNLSTDNENILRGKLEATEKHLEDVRGFTKLLLNNQLGIK